MSFLGSSLSESHDLLGCAREPPRILIHGAMAALSLYFATFFKRYTQIRIETLVSSLYIIYVAGYAIDGGKLGIG